MLKKDYIEHLLNESRKSKDGKLNKSRKSNDGQTNIIK